MKKIIRNIFGVILILIGVVGGFIPVLQGWFFVLTGFIILDFKKKKVYEERIIRVLRKTRVTGWLADMWMYVKNANKDVIEKESSEKVKKIYKDLNKEINKKEWKNR